jgi:drug/metabolite transporter (DMT)-like permease
VRPRIPATTPARTGFVVGLMSVVLGSVNFPVNRYVVTHGFLPLAFVAPRFGAATLVFVAIAAVREPPWQLPQDVLGVALLGGVCLCVNQTALILAAHFMAATTVALFFGTYPIWVALLSQFTEVKDVDRWTLLAAAVSTVGVSIVAVGGHGSVSVSALGLFFALLGPISLAVFSVAMTPMLKRHSPVQMISAAYVAALPLLTLVSVTQLLRQRWSAPTTLDWIGFGYSAVVGLVVSFGLMMLAVKLVGPTKVGLFINAQPFLGVLFSVLLLSETATETQLLGGTILAVSIALAWRSRTAAEPIRRIEADAFASVDQDTPTGSV